MALAECGGLDVLHAHITLPARRRWSARLVLEGDAAPLGAVRLEAVGGLALSGTVVRAGVNNDTVFALVVGGAGGLHRTVAGAFQFAQLRDPLGAVARDAGETLSSTIASDVLGVALPQWTVGGRAGFEIDRLTSVAKVALGSTINWRFLADGTLWLGRETWTTEALAEGAVVVDRFPAERRIVLGVETPALLPGVELEDEGRVGCVEHFIEPERVRSWAWLV